MFRHLPNALTVFRILLVPLFLYMVFNDDTLYALIVFAVAGATDGLDGYIARRWKLTSELGANLDPLADKLLMTGAFASLAYKGMMPMWLSVPVIARDVVILAVVAALRAAGRKAGAAPTIASKATTVLQIIAVLFAMLLAIEHHPLFTPLAAITLLFTLYSGIDYALREIRTQKRID